MAQLIKNSPATQETRVQSLGQEDSLEEEMAIHSSVLVWEIPWTEELGGLQSMVSQRVRHSWATKSHKPQTIPHITRDTLGHAAAAAVVDSLVSDSLATPWTAAYQAPPSMGFSGHEYWSGLPSPPWIMGNPKTLLRVNLYAFSKLLNYLFSSSCTES